jgi:hypothetical protein
MNIKNYIILTVLCASIMTTGCAQWTITGQNTVWKVDETPSSGNGLQYDLVGIYSNPSNGTIPDRRILDKTDVVTISLKNLYLKYINDIYNFDVIVYAEVYDVVDERKVLRRIAFHRENQSPTSYLNIAGNLLYGPIHFTGFPITVKLSVLELDKKDNELFTDFLKVVSSTASAAQPQYGPGIEIAASIMQYVISLNEDDLELSQEITFFPTSDTEQSYYSGNASLVAPLQTGDFVIVKKEDKDRVVFNRWWRFAKRAEDDAKRKFNTTEVFYDASTGRLKYKKADDAKNIKSGDDFIDKTYAVLTLSKSSKAAEREVLASINNSVQSSLNKLLIDHEKTEQEQVDAIKKLGEVGEAEIRFFHLKNRMSGKTKEKKTKILKQFLITDSNPSEADKIFNKRALLLLSEISDEYYADVNSALGLPSTP